MASCLLCGRAVAATIDLWTLLNFQPLKVPTLCAACQATFVSISKAKSCPKCGRLQTDSSICFDCVRWASETFSNRALYDYNAAMKTFFSEYKFRGDYRLRLAFSAELQQTIRKLKVDLIIPIPVTQQTLAFRGFNQVCGMLEGVKLTDALVYLKQEKTVKQSEKARAERMQTAQPFALTDASIVVDRRVLIVDDVYTTGRTIRHAADLILAAGAKSVQGLTLAHG